MGAKELVAKLHPLERKAVPHLQRNGTANELAAASGLQEVEAVRALQWLSNKGCLEMTTEEREELVVSKQGQKAHEEGLPEVCFWRALEKEGLIPYSEIAKHLPSYDEGAIASTIGYLKKSHVPQVTDEAGKPAFKFVKGIGFHEPPAAATLAQASGEGWTLTLDAQNKAGAQDLIKRKGYAELRKRRIKAYKLTPLGVALTKENILGDYADRLTPKDLKSGAWQKKQYRSYDVTINVPAAAAGKPHFVNEAIAHIKQVWLELGFQEMEGDYIQTAFWDLDSLFVPQDHPAREEQDTFYLKRPARGTIAEKDTLKRVKAVHEHGGDTGSLGWRTPYSVPEAERLMLRTHTTVLSAQTLDGIKRGKKPMPGKFFSVDKVFRNEALDWKHLFEFYQVEGIVVDPDANFSHLLGYLELFFKKIGYAKIRVRPAHFPYTEPSVEVDGWHPKKKQWMELGGAGLFRPEVTKTLIGKEVPVLAWGLGMARSISEYFDITDIRDLYSNDLKLLRGMRKWVE